MPRRARAAEGGTVYHCLNRAAGRVKLFRKPEEFDAFVALLAEALTKADVELFGYCLMDDHWHLVLRPGGRGDLEKFMRWIGVTHALRHRAANPRRAAGRLYEGRYRSFPVEVGRPLVTVLGYVESNARRAGIVGRAERWAWSSLAARGQAEPVVALSAWPARRPPNWGVTVNAAMDAKTLASVRTSVQRGSPFGEAAWVARTADRLGLQSSLRAVGRPRKAPPVTPSKKKSSRRV